MIDIDGLKARFGGRFFEDWDGFVDAEKVEASEQGLRVLIDDIAKLGPDASEPDVREAVDRCIRRFNDLDDGWIATIERESIVEQIYEIITFCGFEDDDDWYAERDW